jgi:hypothetical protein
VSYANVKAYSSIMAKNPSDTGGFADLYIKGAPAATLSGSNNLIVSANLGLPDTLTGDPMLAPLANHGGQTRTHALNPLSPAINKGLATGPFDQRGAGFQRAVPMGSPDIGAYERQVIDDEIFYGGFE